jgi:hypothetical protein
VTAYEFEPGSAVLVDGARARYLARYVGRWPDGHVVETRDGEIRYPRRYAVAAYDGPSPFRAGPYAARAALASARGTEARYRAARAWLRAIGYPV